MTLVIGYPFRLVPYVRGVMLSRVLRIEPLPTPIEPVRGRGDRRELGGGDDNAVHGVFELSDIGRLGCHKTELYPAPLTILV